MYMCKQELFAYSGDSLMVPVRAALTSMALSHSSRSNVSKQIPSGLFFDVDLLCYMGSLVMNVHKGNFMIHKFFTAAQSIWWKWTVLYGYCLLWITLEMAGNSHGLVIAHMRLWAISLHAILHSHISTLGKNHDIPYGYCPVICDVP